MKPGSRALEKAQLENLQANTKWLITQRNLEVTKFIFKFLLVPLAVWTISNGEKVQRIMEKL